MEKDGSIKALLSDAQTITLCKQDSNPQYVLTQKWKKRGRNEVSGTIIDPNFRGLNACTTKGHLIVPENYFSQLLCSHNFSYVSDNNFLNSFYD